MEANGSGSVLVVGGGIGGIQASLDLAEAGFRVALVEKSPTIGGKMAQLDKTFPTNDCAMCIMSPKLVDCARHLNIDLHTLAEVESVSGTKGDFTVRIRKKARYVDEDKCTGCRECESVCPVTRSNDFDIGLSTRKAIYRPFPQAAPNVFAIEKTGAAPCTAACPAGCNAHGYVALIRNRKFREAIELIRERVPLPGICGRVCGFCEDECNRTLVDEPLQIRALKRFAADYELSHAEEWAAEDAAKGNDDQQDLSGQTAGKAALASPAHAGEKVAIVGSGPAGLTAAYDLARAGYAPVVFEALEKTGGMLRVGIPAYRLPDEILDHEIEVIQKQGVKIVTSSVLGEDFSLETLSRDGYKAVFLALGTHNSVPLGVDGEQMKGVVGGIAFLREISQGAPSTNVSGKRVAVIGGGNTAVDAVRSALRLGAKSVRMIYRRSREQMPVDEEELVAAEEEGAEIQYLRSPRRVIGKSGQVTAIECSRMRLGPPDDSGRRRPIPIGDETDTYEADIIIAAIGQSAGLPGSDPQIRQIAVQKGIITVDPVTLETSIPGVFAGGDAAGAEGYVVHAIAHGHAAAESIARYLEGRDMKNGRNGKHVHLAGLPDELQQKTGRVPGHRIDSAERLSTFHEVESGFSEEEAVQESSRCLDCGVCSECMQCVEACKAGAVVHDMTDTFEDLHVGSIVLAPGCETYDAHAAYKLGFGAHADVVTSLQFERILSASGPFSGHLQRVSDGKPISRVAFIQCVGSRDKVTGNPYCSSVCCMYAMKEAVIAKEHQKELDATIFYMDIRAHGKDFERYYNRAEHEYGVNFKRARVSGVTGSPAGNGLTVEYETDNGAVSREDFDMVVLSVGFQSGNEIQALSSRLGLQLTETGFISTKPFSSVETRVPGVFICGPAQEPKDIPETVMQASAAAGAAAEILSPARFTEVVEKSYPAEIDVSGAEPRVGVFVCHCGINIGGTVNVPDVVEYATTLPNVVYAERNLYTCSQDTQDHIKEMIKEHDLNRVVVASCTPRTHEPLFQETIREAGLNSHLFEMANIRDQCSWIHMNFPEEATLKAKDLTRMAVAKVRLVEPLPKIPLDVIQKALVIGGGPAGMSAALSLGRQGFGVDLIERDQRLGGHANRVRRTVEGRDTAPLLAEMVSEIERNPHITVHLGSTIESVEGFVGNYKTVVRTASGESREIEHGVTIIATGATESSPAEYLYGQNPLVKTGLEFEDFLHSSTVEELPDRAVFIQCVGSREEEHLYCSRLCCAETVKNATELKKRKPEAEVYVLYRDMRTYGFAELAYQEARDLGVLFLNYEADDKPTVKAEKKGLTVRVRDQKLGAKVTIDASMVILASRIDPEKGNEELSQYFKVPLSKDGFFLEAHVKLRPVDFATEGIFLAGMAHGPKNLAESMAQGRAAAARASTIICKDIYEAEAAIAAVNEDLCDGCGICVGVCEYNALTINEKSDGTKVVSLSEAACKGCGCCVAACPSGAMEQKGFKSEQIMAEIDAALVG